jgi:hypothetical protein
MKIVGALVLAEIEFPNEFRVTRKDLVDTASRGLHQLGSSWLARMSRHLNLALPSCIIPAARRGSGASGGMRAP